MLKFFKNIFRNLLGAPVARVLTGTYGQQSSALRRIHVVVGDIAAQKVDVVVNAANSSLLGGGGVDGAIHRAAGPELLAYCRILGGCEPGDVVGTPGFNLDAKYILHAVGPDTRIFTDQAVADQMLESVYAKAMHAAIAQNTIAFPAISCGIYGFDPERAARIAIQAIGNALEVATWQTVHLVAFDAKMAAILAEELTRQRAQAAMYPISVDKTPPSLPARLVLLP